MSVETPVAKPPPKPVFQLTPKEKKILKHPLWYNNPITFQILGICSALAVTVQMQTALVMSVALTVVVTASNVVISLLRNHIPSKIRIIVQLSVIASLGIVVDQITIRDLGDRVSRGEKL